MPREFTKSKVNKIIGEFIAQAIYEIIDDFLLHKFCGH